MPDSQQSRKKRIAKPEWQPEDSGSAFAGSYIPGTDQKALPKSSTNKRRQLSTADLYNGIVSGNRMFLGRALTLIESNAAAHQEQAQELLTRLLPLTGKSVRIGITGIPGAGKSTFIERLGLYLIENGHRIAVLAIDPSSSISKGSILGDKTRMEKLAQNEAGFIRPSPSGGTLGGVARKTRESLLVCEAAGFDVVIVETVGVGQSEVSVRSMVDFFLLLQITGGGDELQGIKKGVIELADAIAINKADGENQHRAAAMMQEMKIALHYLTPFTANWQPTVSTCSALNGAGIPEIWQNVRKFCQITQHTGQFMRQRQQQTKSWLHDLTKESLEKLFLEQPEIAGELPEIENAVMSGKIHAVSAAKNLVEIFRIAIGSSSEKT
ncbi:MAG: methylmalonyl Co-A mutase-associated GTPase MeaB [Calditrichaeota bacterium]|nr:methylmalonyl Co-A mutase-associated GTPase MeaB [Calditrichota bacterium]